MPGRLIGQQYEDESRAAGYPFADAATLTSQAGFTLPRGAIYDASLRINGGVPPYYLASLTLNGATVTLNLGDANNTAIASAVFATSPPPSVLPLWDQSGRPAGCLLTDPVPLAAVETLPEGVSTFSPTATEFVGRVVVPTIQSGLDSLVVAGVPMTGDVWLVGGIGVAIRSPLSSQLRIDVLGDANQAAATCAATNPIKTPLRTINGITPDAHGRFAIVAESLSVATGATTLRIHRGTGNALSFSIFGRPLQS